MSRIYFHTPERTAEVLGRERAYTGCLAGDIALAVIDPQHSDYDWLRAVSGRDVPDYVFERPDDWLRMWKTWFRVGWNESGLVVKGEEIGTTDLALNTLIATRSPVLMLLATLHGMCEDHAWIASEDAEWFADLIDVGRRDNVLRPDMGWESIAELARQVSADALPWPIVTSYSVCKGFPNASVAGAARDAWYDLFEDEQWALALRGIRACEHNRQISPATLGQGFMSGASAFDLCAEREAAVV